MIGEIIAWGGDLSPAVERGLERKGWLPCHGQLKNKRKYHSLWDVVGTRFSIPGEVLPQGEFRVPDLRGRTMIGAGLGDGLQTTRNLGERIGAETHQLSIAEMPSHTHSAPYSSGRNSPKHPDDSWNEYGLKDAEIPTGAAGGNQPHNNIQPSMVVHFLIRCSGGPALEELDTSWADDEDEGTGPEPSKASSGA